MRRFIIFNATADTKRWMHKQRNAYRRMDDSPSRVPVPMAFEPGSLMDGSFEPAQDDILQITLVLEKKLKAKPKFAKIFNLLLKTGFDKKQTINLLVTEGNTKSSANKVVTSVLKELRNTWS